jgi:hypothetical protein
MRDLLRLFGQIALSRKGPQDVPASPLLLALTVAAYTAVAFSVNSMVPPPDTWRAELLLDVGFSLAWYAILLRAFGKPERYLQTTTAMFGYQTLLAAPLFALLNIAARLPQESGWAPPVAIVAIALVIWTIRAASYVLKAALELPMVACVALIFAEILAGRLVQLLAFNPSTTVR